MPAQQLIVQQMQLLGNNGLPLAAGRAFFYLTGTTTLIPPADLVDADGDPYANPVIADGSGYIPQPYYTGASQVKIVVRTALGTTVSTIDPVPLAPSVGPTATGLAFAPVSGITSTNVQAALAEIAPLNEDSMATRSNTRPPTQDSLLQYLSAGLNIDGNLRSGTTSDFPSGTVGDFGVAVRANGRISMNSDGTLVDLSRANDGTMMFFRNNTTIVGSISVDASSTTYATSSGRARKKNIMPAGDAGDIIDAIQPVSFQWKESGVAVGHGFIAQDLAEVFPDAVVFGESENDPAWGVDPSKMVALMMTEIQSLRRRLEILETAQ